MITHRSFTCLVLALASLTAPGRSQTREAFDKGLAKVRSLMKRGSWKRAKDELDGLLFAHERQDYVVAKRVAIIEDIKRCVFRSEHDEPEAKDVISGKLERYNSRTGQIKLVYTRDRLQDFEKSDNGLYMLPLTFQGSYSIEVRGKHYPTGAVQLILGAEGATAYTASFGHAPNGRGLMKARIQRIEDRRKDEIADDDSRAEIGEKYRATAQVSRGRIALKYNGRKLVSAKTPDDPFGSFGFFDMMFDELVIDGKAQPSWIQGRLDAVRHKALAEFEKSWRPSRYVPSWLLRTAIAGNALEIDDSYPGLETAQHENTIDEIHKLIDESGDYAKVLQFVKGLSDRRLPKLTRTYVEALANESLGNVETAIDRYRSVVEQDSSILSAKLAAARLVLDLGRVDDVTKAFDQLITANPDHWQIYETYALGLLAAGRPDDAKAIVAAGLRRPRVRGKLASLDRMLIMAKTGPAWPKTYDFKSRHYHIFSDIDRETCIEASKILEDALTIYRVRLARADIERGQRFRVYLFSGEAGYKAYVDEIIGGISMHTAGLFSPHLKQLLIWNLPDRAAMMRTIRHEGFHQFLDVVAPNAPVWFNEGMAEFYETMKRDQRGSLQGGQKRDDHLATLRRHPPVSLERFIKIGRRSFYEHPARNYAQAWLTIHFLRERSAETRKIFKTLIDELQSGKSGQRAIAAAFEGVDLVALEREYRAHMGAL